MIKLNETTATMLETKAFRLVQLQKIRLLITIALVERRKMY
jgi:hypothetical protein